MNADPRPQAPLPMACPWPVAYVGLQPDDRLLLPVARRMVVQCLPGATGPVLTLFHGTQEITFDELWQFDFGQTLARQHVFRAADATGWGRGYAWAQVQEWLQDLLDAGVLRRLSADEPAPALRPVTDGLAVDSPLPPAPCARPRAWHEAGTLMTELTGRAFDPAWLELAVPVFRIAHPALDAEGRQVGEANVFPPALRLDVPTRWRTCIYDGTRHLAAQPMNVAALKAMRTHWPQMMALLRRQRAAYLARYPEAAEGWTVGHLERLATSVLALPTWLLMRAQRPVASGALHPALSSLFRVTDGLRMVMHQMLFVPVGEPARRPDDRVTAAEVHAYAERNYAFHSEHGVCAGPRAMVDEFLAVLMDGRLESRPDERPVGWPADAEPALDEAMAALDDALDYGLRGLQVYAVGFSLWPQMVRDYEALAAAVRQALEAAGDGGRAGPLADLHQRLQAHLQSLSASSYLATEPLREHRDRVYADMLAQCTRGLREPAGDPLAQRLQPWAAATDAAAEAALARAWRQALGAAVDTGALQGLTLAILRRTRALVAEAERVQGRLNHHLGRPDPRRPLQAADLDLHNLLQGAAQRRLPFLLDELQAILGCTLSVTATQIDVTFPLGRPSAGRPPAQALRIT